MRRNLVVVFVLCATSWSANGGMRAQSPGAPPSIPGTQAPQAGRGADPAGRGTAAAPRIGTSIIRGRVTSDTGTPLRRAQVRLVAPGAAAGGRVQATLVLTDEQGRFEFKALPAARYTLSASKSGYLGLSFGQRRPLDTGRPIELGDAQVIDRADFRLPKGGVVVVRVTDDLGESVPGSHVQLESYRYISGERRLVAAVGASPLTSTNDLGILRVSGVPPGEYFVNAGPPLVGAPVAVDERGLTFVPTYYPGTLSANEAQRVAVALGQEVNVTVPIISARPARVSGVVHRSDGGPFLQPYVSLRDTTATGGVSRNMFPQPDGTFALANVLPGSYTIDVSPSTLSPSATQEFAQVPLQVNGEDIADLAVVTSRGANLSGRFVFDGGTPPPTLRAASFQVSVSFPSEKGGASSQSTSNDDWTFEIASVIGSGVIGIRSVPGWFLKEVRLDGNDVIDTPVEFAAGKDIKDVDIVLTQTTTTVTGGVVGASGKAATDYVVVLFSDDRDRWVPRSRFIAAGRPDQESRFKITGLPPGRYLAAAVEYLEPGAERDPEVLTRLQSGAQRLTLGEGQSQTLSLRLR